MLKRDKEDERLITSFKQIPQMQVGCWSVTLEWGEGFLKWFKQEKEGGLDMQPAFQRPLVWTTDQQIRYVEYILQGGASGKDLYFNHPHWTQGKTYTPGVKTNLGYVCVDGQQRVEAITAFLENKLLVFGTYFFQFEDNIRTTCARSQVHIASLREEDAVLRWYKFLNSGGTPHTEEDYKYVDARLKELADGKE